MDDIPRLTMPLALVMLFSTFILLGQAHGINSLKFPVGANASIDFSLELRQENGSSISFQLYMLDNSAPFYEDGQMVPSVLKPDQLGRFEVTSSQQGINFTVTLLIKNIQVNDSQIYILNLREPVGGENLDQLVNLRVSVISSSSTAECRISDLAFVAEWYEILCWAPLSSGEDRSIDCYKDADRALPNGLIEVSPPLMKAKFWVQLDYPINCCSYEINHRRDSNSCNDYVYNPTNLPVIATSTPSSNPEEKTVKVPSNCNTTVVTAPTCTCAEDNHKALIVTFIVLLCIAIVMMAGAFWHFRGKELRHYVKRWRVLEDHGADGNDFENTL